MAALATAAGAAVGPRIEAAPSAATPVAAASRFELPPQGMLVDSYAAVVKDKVVTVGDVMAAAAPAQARASATLQGDALAARLAEIYAEVREELVGVKLIQLEFEAMGVVLPPRAIEDHVSAVIQDRFHGDRAALMEALAQSRMTMDEWREQMRQQLVVQVMRGREIDSKIAISPIDVQRAYDAEPGKYALPAAVRLEVMSIRAPRPGKASEREAARAFYRKLLRTSYGTGAGRLDLAALQEEFAILDVQHEAADGWLPVGDLAPEFQSGLEGVEPGALAKPVSLGGRTFFLRVLERREASAVALEDAAREIEAELRAQEQARLMKNWIEELKSKYHVQLFDHALFMAPEGE